MSHFEESNKFENHPGCHAITRSLNAEIVVVDCAVLAVTMSRCRHIVARHFARPLALQMIDTKSPIARLSVREP